MRLHDISLWRGVKSLETWLSLGVLSEFHPEISEDTNPMAVKDPSHPRTRSSCQLGWRFSWVWTKHNKQSRLFMKPWSNLMLTCWGGKVKRAWNLQRLKLPWQHPSRYTGHPLGGWVHLLLDIYHPEDGMVHKHTTLEITYYRSKKSSMRNGHVLSLFQPKKRRNALNQPKHDTKRVRIAVHKTRVYGTRLKKRAFRYGCSNL